MILLDRNAADAPLDGRRRFAGHAHVEFEHRIGRDGHVAHIATIDLGSHWKKKWKNCANFLLKKKKRKLTETRFGDDGFGRLAGLRVAGLVDSDDSELVFQIFNEIQHLGLSSRTRRLQGLLPHDAAPNLD